PLVLRSCSDFIEVHGIVDGIYRLSGVSSNTQKLRSEFDTEGTPDLYKDVYLQDIHCVSSLCKAYFRELPNPLLTYQLYDRFAEAVAVQLENERLVKIKEVLSELPNLHYRTLQYLMRHLVRMATHASKTNMHARNLAIVWAPNLLRSKDIEASGFNGTAAFMEVRVQSIVVEFILTHVAQLFPEPDSESGLTAERRKSLPSPSALSSQEDQFFRGLPIVQYPGNMSPGDGPLPMRPYHAVIDGTDKRKGSLKGRKWMSIFNLGGRLQDPRKKNKYATKEKEKTALRPAKSMDSLSTGSYTQEGMSSQHPSSHQSSLAAPSGNSEGGASSTGNISSGYAVTYRRTGGASVSMVSAGSGTQGTYKALETRGIDKPQATLHGATSKAERRVGMHISGPFSVTVPLHITSGLALGVLHGGRAEEEQCTHESLEEKPVKQVKQENAGDKEECAEKVKEQTDGKTEGREGDDTKEDVLMDDEKSLREGPEKKTEKGEEPDEEEARCKDREDLQDKDKEDDDFTKEEESEVCQHADNTSLTTDTMEAEYMDMRAGMLQDSATLNLSPEEEYPDLDLPLDFQDTFGFLDSLDTSAPSQLNEFSVEPPCFEDEEEEEEEKEEEEEEEEEGDRWRHTAANTHMPLPGKSYSLPYKSLPPMSFSSDDDDDYSGPDDDDNEEDSDKSEYEDMFCKSLPSDQQFQGLNWTINQPITCNYTDSSADSHSHKQSECLNQTYTIEIPEGTQSLSSVTDSENLTHTDIEMTTNLGMDINASDHCLNQVNLSQLPLEIVHSSMDKKNSEDRNTNCVEESESEGAGLTSEPTEELENTDTNANTHICSYNQEGHSKASDDEEDTYFGPDTGSTSLEPSEIETSHPSVQHLVKEEHANSDVQQDSSEDDLYIASSEVTVTDEPITEPLATGSISLATQDESEIIELSVEQNVTLHIDEQDWTDRDNEGEEQNEGREDGGQGQDEKNKISVTGKDVGNGVNKGEEESTGETNCKTSSEIKEEHERMSVENLKGEGKGDEVWEGVKHEGDADKSERDRDELEEERQIISERNEEGIEQMSIEKGKERQDGQKGNNQGTEEDDSMEEIEARKEETAKINDRTVVKEGTVREMSEEEDSLSDELAQDDSGSGLMVHPEDQQRVQEEEKEPAPSELDSPKPLRPPRMKEREAGRDAGLGPGAGRTVVISKPPPLRVFQVKAVPVVPPKPQHCKLTAFRQQLQQKDAERQYSQIQPADGEKPYVDRGLQARDTVRHVQQDGTKERGMEFLCSNEDREHNGAENVDERESHDSRSREQRKSTEGERLEENMAEQVKKQPKDTFLVETCPGSGWQQDKGEQEEDRNREVGKERQLNSDGGIMRKDGLKESEREAKRTSGISMCFDEAVARATGKRCREKESAEKERFIDLQFERDDQKEGLTPRKREEKGKTD
ncbi:hypothetical protein P4O66_014720, partial [Electrophorus voltai]